MGSGNFEREKGVPFHCKVEGTLRSSVQKRLNNDLDAVWVVGSDGPHGNHTLVGVQTPEVLREVVMATHFGFLYTGCTLAPSGEYD